MVAAVGPEAAVAAFAEEGVEAALVAAFRKEIEA